MPWVRLNRMDIEQINVALWQPEWTSRLRGTLQGIVRGRSPETLYATFQMRLLSSQFNQQVIQSGWITGRWTPSQGEVSVFFRMPESQIQGNVRVEEPYTRFVYSTSLTFSRLNLGAWLTLLFMCGCVLPRLTVCG